MSEARVENCPMCQGAAVLDTLLPRVICLTPDCPMPAICGSTDRDTVTRWNTRAPRASEGEARFLEASREYARLMTRDARNAHDPAKVRSEIDRARGEFYAAYKALETP